MTGMLTLRDLAMDASPIPGEMVAWRIDVTPEQWRGIAGLVADGQGRLVALWAADRRDLGQGFDVWAAYAVADGAVCVCLSLPADSPQYPDIAERFPAAGRMQRAAFDLVGVVAAGAVDRRPWLRHATWPADAHPLRRDADGASVHPRQDEIYPFVSVIGEGVHEIPVGPVHAGTIEPGHFRFSILGERVMRLEQHLGYKHKGIEKRFESLPVLEGGRLAGRVSGDSTVAYAWAYAMAVEGAAAVDVPPRARWLRALLLERERVANHLGDLGFVGNDAGLAFALAQFSRLKEDWLRLNAALFGHRYLMDIVVPGGVSCDLDPAREREIRAQIIAMEGEVAELQATFGEHAGLQDRLRHTGRVTPELAARLGLTGLGGRASGQAFDLRVDHPVDPYTRARVTLVTREEGDVAARVAVRFGEVHESLRLIEVLLDSHPDGDVHTGVTAPAAGRIGIGRVEGWRGEVFVFLEAGPDGTIRRCHPHDPSWQNWPLLEHAVLGNIVPDFPLINKSFNLSYSGPDL